MIDDTFARSLGLIVVAAALFAIVARRIRLPGIVAYLVAGLVLGPATGLVSVNEGLELISETGIVLLLFLVGLELSLQKIRVVGKAVLIAGIAQVALTAGAALGLGMWLGVRSLEAVFLAVALTLSSTVVVVKLLDEKHDFAKLYGRISVGILLVQDMVVILLLTLLAGMKTGGGQMDAGTMVVGILKAFGGIAVLVAGVLLALKFLLPKVFGWASRSPETLFIWSLCWCFLVLAGAHFLHLSHESGAFLAGVALAQLPYSHDLRRRVHPLMNFFVAVFFVTLGINMEFGIGALGWEAMAALCAFVLIAKPILVTIITRLLKFTARTSILTGITLGQVSEFSFILLAMGGKADLVGPGLLSTVGLVGLITIAVSSCGIQFNEALYRAWSRLTRKQGEDEPPEERRLHGHVIVVGMNTLGRELVKRLSEHGEETLAIDTDPRKLRELPGRTLLGSAEYLSVLEEAGLAKAKLLVSALQIEDVNDLLAYRCKEFGVPSSIHGIDLSVVDNLMEMDVAYLMIPKVDGIKLQNRTLEEMGMVASPSPASSRQPTHT